MYAKIINKETKQCEVGIGTNTQFYESIGMIEMEVEQAYNGNWYVKGYCPKKPKEIKNQERIAELQEYLKSTAWYCERKIDSGKEIPEDVRIKRQEARDEISKLRG